jgi:CubicO group peptidase (beta-lactamase class C family)
MAVAVARDGEIIWEEGFGLADREKNIPATEHTSYPLASISKPLTATGLMILVERGLINLDRPINDYLGEAKLQAWVGDAAEATVRRVASHTSGLPLFYSQHFSDDELYQPPPMDETIRRFGNLVTAPGERYQYSNLGYGLCGYVISRVSGQSYTDFMRKEVFVPLGMDHTSVHIGPGLEEGQAAKYTPDGLVVPPYDSDSPGASAIYSSAHDLIRFAMFHLKNALPDQKAIISDAAIDAMQNPSPETGPLREWEREGSGYGIGWFIGVTEDGLRVIQHNGGTVGVSTVLALVPEENLAVAVLSNTHSQWPDVILIEIVCTLLSCQPGKFLPSVNGTADEPPFVPPPELVGLWEGFVRTDEGEIPLVLEIGESGSVYATLGDQPGTLSFDRLRTQLQDVSYRDGLPKFMNAGGGLFLRGWMLSDLGTADVNQGRPYKLWLELKLRESVLNGSLIVFSQREISTGPLTHWVELRKRAGE